MLAYQIYSRGPQIDTSQTLDYNRIRYLSNTLGVFMNITQLSWNYGSAFDLFTSLHVLHQPARFGLRAAWAAGVRSRLSGEDRETLEQAEAALWIPLY